MFTNLGERNPEMSAGLTVHAYLTQLPLQRAKDLLQTGTGSADIALSVGFYDQSHLINKSRRISV
jgi:AraC-like DNA-binding protein